MFSYTKKKSFQSDDLCLDVSALGGPVKLYQCHGLGGNQLWDYNHVVRTFYLLKVFGIAELNLREDKQA